MHHLGKFALQFEDTRSYKEIMHNVTSIIMFSMAWFICLIAVKFNSIKCGRNTTVDSEVALVLHLIQN